MLIYHSQPNVDLSTTWMIYHSRQKVLMMVKVEQKEKASSTTSRSLHPASGVLLT
jgi:hypothetical protein